MKILLIDENHPSLKQELLNLGWIIDEKYLADKKEIENIISDYNGIIIRSRIPVDKQLLGKAVNLKFIARVGAGLENIDIDFASKKNIKLINAPEGNRNAVAEHTLGMLLNLSNKICSSNEEIRNGIWKREENRGEELDGKIVGIIGYGNTGKSFAKKLTGFDTQVLTYDIKPDVEDKNAKQVDMQKIFDNADIISLHVPLTDLTKNMVNNEFINKFKKNFLLLNTSRGQVVKTADLVKNLKTGKISGAGLDVLEYEKSSFESMFENNRLPIEFKELINMNNVILTPHIAGWTHQSNKKLAQTIVNKIKNIFYHK